MCARVCACVRVCVCAQACIYGSMDGCVVWCGVCVCVCVCVCVWRLTYGQVDFLYTRTPTHNTHIHQRAHRHTHVLTYGQVDLLNTTTSTHNTHTHTHAGHGKEGAVEEQVDEERAELLRDV